MGPQGSPDAPAEVLRKLLTVDGPGSGLDADTLGGRTAGFYLKGTGQIISDGNYLYRGAAQTVFAQSGYGSIVANCSGTPSSPSVTLVFNSSAFDNQIVLLDDGAGDITESLVFGGTSLGLGSAIVGAPAHLSILMPWMGLDRSRNWWIEIWATVSTTNGGTCTVYTSAKGPSGVN